MPFPDDPPDITPDVMEAMKFEEEEVCVEKATTSASAGIVIILSMTFGEPGDASAVVIPPSFKYHQPQQ